MNTRKLSTLLKHAKGTWGVIVKRVGGEILFEHNADFSFPAASVGKVSIALYILHLVDVGRTTLDQVLKVQKKFYVTGSGVLQHFTPNAKLTIRDLGILMLTISDNTAAKVLVRHYDAKRINAYIHSLGFKKTKLGIRGTEFDFGTTSPREMAVLLEGIYAGAHLSKKSSQLLIEIMKKCSNELGIPRYLPRKGKGRLKTVQVAHKTGAIDGVRNDAGIVLTKHPYVISIFSKGQKDNSYGPQNEALFTIADISKEIFNILK